MNDEPRDVDDDDVEGHAIVDHPSRPGQGPDIGGKRRFRPDEDEMFGDDTAGHAQFQPNEDEMFGDDPRPS